MRNGLGDPPEIRAKKTASSIPLNMEGPLQIFYF